jgi:citrate synthase
MERLQQIAGHLTGNQLSSKKPETLSVTDNRTGKTYELALKQGSLNGNELAKIIDEQQQTMKLYDPGYVNVVNCTSRICYIDGDTGILEYRGYPIEQLAEKSTFLEVAFLLIYGELPTKADFKVWQKKIMTHTFIHTDVAQMMKSFRYDAHPMGMLVSTMAAVSTFHPESNPALQGENVYDGIKVRNKQVHRILGIMPTIAANSYRHRIGRNYNLPQNDLGYVENFLYMLDRLSETKYKPHPKLVKALDVLFILHAEHELNCSTAAVRHLASSGVDVYTCVAGAAAALYGPKHGGANEAVVRMLESIGDKKNIPQFIEDVKNRKKLLFGFGHRVYKNYDPRAKIVRKIANDVFEVVGKESLIEIAVELEKIALSDEFFIKRKLYPNVDFYSGVIYRSLGFPTDYYPVLFTIPRTAGWLAHWLEFLDDKEQKIVRPRQNYKGSTRRDYITMEDRKQHQFFLESTVTSKQRRRMASTQENWKV